MMVAAAAAMTSPSAKPSPLPRERDASQNPSAESRRRLARSGRTVGMTPSLGSRSKGVNARRA